MIVESITENEKDKIDKVRTCLADRVLDLKVQYTDHFIQRLIEREISKDEVYHTLLDNYDRIRLFLDMGEVVYPSDRLTLVFEVNKGYIKMITAMNYRPRHIKGAMII